MLVQPVPMPQHPAGSWGTVGPGALLQGTPFYSVIPTVRSSQTLLISDKLRGAFPRKHTHGSVCTRLSVRGSGVPKPMWAQVGGLLSVVLSRIWLMSWVGPADKSESGCRPFDGTQGSSVRLTGSEEETIIHTLLVVRALTSLRDPPPGRRKWPCKGARSSHQVQG